MTAERKLESIELIQGTPEWLALRKKKITATDSSIIMGVSHWKTKVQLYHEKLSNEPPMAANERMQRGIDLEPIARNLYSLQHGIEIEPKVIIKDWAMASLDGIDYSCKHIVEIKCPGEKDHAISASGKVPEHYYPQLQHQMYVCDVQQMHYFSFDGIDGITITVKRDEEYISKMIEEEKKFYQCIINEIPPEPSEGDYIERNDPIWQKCASHWAEITSQIKELEMIEEDLRKQLIFLSGESNSKGAGISLCQVQRKGNVDYANIPELKGVDLDKYRKRSINSWRITCS
jgi:putative phage-type endonuclease